MSEITGAEIVPSVRQAFDSFMQRVGVEVERSTELESIYERHPASVARYEYARAAMFAGESLHDIGVDEMIEQAKAVMSSLPDSAKTVAQLHTDLAKLDRERDELNSLQAEWETELRTIRERHALERKARARGERVPSLHSDPAAYAAWLKDQRMLPYTELAQSLNKQSR